VHRIRPLLALALVVCAAPLQAAPKDIAELFPAETLVFVEVRQTAPTAKQLAAFFQGTSFENALPAIDKIREKRRPNQYVDTAGPGILAAFLGPEMLKEFGRLEGMAAALTCFDKNGEPQLAAVVLTGDSQVPGFMMRAYLSAGPSLRKVATVEGFDLYQETSNVFVDDPLLDGRGEGARQTSTPYGPVVAYQPGIILVGSDKEAASAIIRRYKGREKSAALASSPTFKQAQAQRDAPGLFLFADAKKLLKTQTAPEPKRDEPNPYLLVLLQRLLPTAGIGAVTARLQFHEQGIDLRCALKLTEAAARPLADFFSGPSLSGVDLNEISKDAPLALTLRLPDAKQRLPLLLGVLDPIVKSTGTLGPSASEILHDLEEKKVLSSAALAKVNRLTLVVAPFASWLKGEPPLPTVIIHADDAEDLPALEAAIPKVLELLGGNKADAVTETIDGIKVRSLEAKASPLGAPIHYAQLGAKLAIGPDRRAVAASLRADPALSMALKPEVVEAVKSAGGPAFVAVLNGAGLLTPPAPKQRNEPPPPPNGPRPARPNGNMPETSAAPNWAAYLPKEAVAVLNGLPPLVLAVKRDKNELRFELIQRDPNRWRVKAVEQLFEVLMERNREAFATEIDGPIVFPGR
jgi:hypothetical protein